MTLASILAEAEKQALMDALNRHGGNVTRASKDLDICRSQFYRRAQIIGLRFRFKTRAVLPSRELGAFLGARC